MTSLGSPEPISKVRLFGRFLKIVVILSVVTITVYQTVIKNPGINAGTPQNIPRAQASPASEALRALDVKGRAPKTDYSRDQFGNGWIMINGCDTRNRILARDLTEITFVPTLEPSVCKVQSGVLKDPYTGMTVKFVRGETTSDDVQIDHVVALSDAWQKGAQQLSPREREAFANDPLELLAVDGRANQQKADSDAASWLPENKSFRCNYVAKQIAVKKKYRLWITQPEYDAMARVLETCPNQPLPS